MGRSKVPAKPLPISRLGEPERMSSQEIDLIAAELDRAEELRETLINALRAQIDFWGHLGIIKGTLYQVQRKGSGIEVLEVAA